MEYKKHSLTSTGKDAVFTEIWFEVSTARVFGTEVIGFEIYDTDDSSRSRTARQVRRTLRSMKEKGLIQFFATADSFADSAPEAEFLKNKYPHLSDEFICERDGTELLLVKL